MSAYPAGMDLASHVFFGMSPLRCLAPACDLPMDAGEHDEGASPESLAFRAALVMEHRSRMPAGHPLRRDGATAREMFRGTP